MDYDIDIHTHILSSLDDGPENMDQSLEMARKFVDHGTRRIFATPHGYSPYFHADKRAIINTLDIFTDLLSSNGIALEVRIGMEIRIHLELLAHILSNEAMCLGDKRAGERFLLLELPTREWPQKLLEVIYELRIRHITPIIAHPERNFAVMQHPAIVSDAVSEGAWLQITAGSCTGAFGSNCLKTAKRLASEGWIHLVASDAHDLVHRAPGLLRAWEVIHLSWRLPEVVTVCRENAETIWQSAVS